MADCGCEGLDPSEKQNNKTQDHRDPGGLAFCIIRLVRPQPAISASRRARIMAMSLVFSGISFSSAGSQR